MKVHHEFCMFSSNCFIVVMNQKAVCPLLMRLIYVAKVALKTRDYLLKRLFIYGTWGFARIEVNLINALSKEPRETPL